MAAELQAALVRAVASGGQVEPAFAIAQAMVNRRLMDGSAEVMIALTLFELTLKHYQQTPDAPDPYVALSHRLVAAGRLRQSDVDTAVYGRILSTGLAQGWLDARFYDRIAVFAGEHPAVRSLMAQIERRVHTEPQDSPPVAPSP